MAVNEVTVEVTTLDDWLAARADLAGRPAVAKIDVEGAELTVLAGARRFIAERRPALIIEVAIDAGHRRRVAEFCEQVGYQILVIRNSGTLAPDPLDHDQFAAMSYETNFFVVDAKWDPSEFAA